ncbi:hypothetical protein SCLCIDRAFT_957970 [Scleroderma citrinum Foug A]|uniref:Uncharacterized protein n=1 Tax=Scleroderma citrinum Foug A TaxID=1036808 RepID=A0A0C3EJX2_9AGAM|nr:hypothetical protein SCLCIDRAFT_957970 [Scleroderma citrinum Foug A]
MELACRISGPYLTSSRSTRACARSSSRIKDASSAAFLCTRVSNISFAVSSVGEVFILVIMVGILEAIKAGDSTETIRKPSVC